MERKITPHQNWTLRYIIQNAHSVGVEPDGSEDIPIDPLESVKLHYFQVFTQAIGQPDMMPDSSPFFAAAAQNISGLVDYSAESILQLYDAFREDIRQRIPRASQHDAEQYLNRLIAEVGRGYERVILTTVDWMNEEDFLMEHRLGRLIRRVRPSVKQQAVIDARDKTKREIKAISREFMEEIARRSRR